MHISQSPTPAVPWPGTCSQHRMYLLGARDAGWERASEVPWDVARWPHSSCTDPLSWATGPSLQFQNVLFLVSSLSGPPAAMCASTDE